MIDPTGKEIAITFDACESSSPALMDTTILNYLIKEKIPATIFLGGKFCKRNYKILKEISKYGFLEFENHSYSHKKHTEKISENEIIYEINETNKTIKEITNRTSKFFRFPAGNYNRQALNTVEKQGLKVVHWSFASGDPDKKISPQKIIKWVISKTKSGSILIFHINGRGVHTGEILPELVNRLRDNQFSFVKLQDVTLK